MLLKNQNSEITTNIALDEYWCNIDALCEMIRRVIQPTLGPFGQANLIHNHSYSRMPEVSRDGFDGYTNFVIQSPSSLRLINDYFNEIVSTMIHRVGDGTSTAIMITIDIIQRYLYYIQRDRKNPMDAHLMRLVLESILEIMTREDSVLHREAVRPANRNEVFENVKRVISTSCGNEQDIQDTVIETWSDYLETGSIPKYVINNSHVNPGEDVVTRHHGVEITALPMFSNQYHTIASNSRSAVDYHNGLILMSRRDIDKEMIKTIVNTIEYCQKGNDNRPLIIVAPVYTEDVQDYIEKVVSQNRRQLMQKEKVKELRLVTLQYNRESSTEVAEFNDLAALTGATVLVSDDEAYRTSESDGHNVLPTNTAVLHQDLGVFTNYKSEAQDYSRFINELTSPLLDRHIKSLRDRIEQLDGPPDQVELKRSEFQYRINTLTQGIIEINPGGDTQGDRARRRALFDDATRSSIHALEGTLPGGCVTTTNILMRDEIVDEILANVKQRFATHVTDKKIKTMIYLVARSFAAPYCAIRDIALQPVSEPTHEDSVADWLLDSITSGDNITMTSRYTNRDHLDQFSRFALDIFVASDDSVSYVDGISFEELDPEETLEIVSRQFSDTIDFEHDIVEKLQLRNPGAKYTHFDTLYDIVRGTYDTLQDTHVRVPLKTEVETIRLACSVASIILTSNMTIDSRVDSHTTSNKLRWRDQSDGSE